jgi:oxaloacetate decarboxylase beta subunit
MKTMLTTKGWSLAFGLFLLLGFSGWIPAAAAGEVAGPVGQSMPDLVEMLRHFGQSTGLAQFLALENGHWTEGVGRLFMIGIGVVLLYLAIGREFEPLLLLPIGFGAILSNIPLAGMNDPGGILYFIYTVGIKTGAFPLIIFMGIGTLTDFGPMLANPKTALLGAAAQFGIFTTLIGALIVSEYVPGIHFTLLDAASIGIIGGADGPTAIFLSSQLSPRLLGSIAVAAYSYMALVPIIQPPIIRLLTSHSERTIRMNQMRYVGKVEKIVFPLIVLALSILLLPSAAPLIGFFMFGNLMRECGVVERLSKTAQNALLNIVTIFLGLGVGAQMSAEKFLNASTLGILFLGVIAFSIGTASGVLMAKLMNLFPGTKINPLIGSAGVSAVPMAARVSHRLGMEADSENMLLMHAMGPNVAGVIGSAVAAGVLLTLKDFAG